MPLLRSEKYRSLYTGEKCCACEEEQPEDKTVIRHENTDNIICITCLIAIAEMN